jgi:hypothetical protein
MRHRIRIRGCRRAILINERDPTPLGTHLAADARRLTEHKFLHAQSHRSGSGCNRDYDTIIADTGKRFEGPAALATASAADVAPIIYNATTDRSDRLRYVAIDIARWTSGYLNRSQAISCSSC